MAAIAMTSPLDFVLARLKGVKRNGSGYVAKCAAHEDASPSLSVAQGRDGRVLLHCHAGCSVEAICQAIGLETRDLFPDRPAEPRPSNGNGASQPLASDRPTLVKTYDYTDEHGTMLFQACRLKKPDGGKTFRQRRPDGNGGWIWKLDDVRLVPYRLPELLEAVAMKRRVFVVEGEKDADALWAEGQPATTNPMGAGKWREEFARYVAGAEVVILPDNDEPGRQHAEQVAASLTQAGCTVRVVALPNVPDKGDVSDWLASGGDFDALDQLIGQTRIWTTDPLRKARWRLDELLDNDEIMRPPAPVVPRLAWRGRSTLLAAAPKAGKSTLVGFTAAQVSLGGTFLEEPVDRGTVLIFGVEEYLGDVARRLRHFGADATRIHVVDHLPTDPRERPSAVAAHVDAVKPDLVIVDTLLAYGRGLIEDENNAVQTQAVTQGLTDLAHHAGVALLIVHHATKATGKFRGSSAIAGSVDAVAELSIPDEDKDPTRRVIKAIGRVPIHGFEYRLDGDLLVLANATGAPLIQRVLDFIRTNPQTPLARVRAAIGGRAESVDDAINRLMQRGWVKDVGSRQARAYEVAMYAPKDVLREWGGGAGV